MIRPTLPHHPSSAELAAFRRDVRDAIDLPDMAWREAAFASPDHGAAFPHERQVGLGHTAGPRANVIWRAWDPSTEARAGANALRATSHAARWALLPNTWWTPGHPPAVQESEVLGARSPGDRYYTAAWLEEIDQGLPAWPFPLRGEPCSADRECGAGCSWDEDNGFVREGTRGGNGDPEEDVQFECWCEHHQP